MSNIYQAAVQAVEEGAKFSIDFASRSFKLGGKPVIRNGQYEGELGVPSCTEEEFFANMEELFRALPERELSDEDMLYGQRRDRAQAELELYLLCQILSGLKWNPETMGSWFWQSKQDKDLVILRQWVEPDYNNQSITN